MAKFNEMDPEEVLRLIQGHKNILKGLEEREKEFLRNSRCPKCSTANHEASIDAKNPFSPGSALSNKILTCHQCKTQYNPYTGFIIA